MRDRALRVLQTCRQVAQMTEEPGRTTRRFLTPPVRDVHDLFRNRMQGLGMQVCVDGVGNLRGLWRPGSAHDKLLAIGSHIDTVPNAGAFDGVLGVVLALEWVELAQQIGVPFAIEVIAFSEEEGVRFGVPFIGSHAVAGSFDPARLELCDADGITVEQAIQAFGLDPASIPQAVLSKDAFGFVEIHIEQGPVLEAEQLSVATVTAIVGQTRGTMSFQGQANHAGTTPMRMRRDALAAAAEWISAVEDIGLRVEGLVATVGKIHVEPNAGNVIAGTAEVSLDCRHADDAARASAIQDLIVRANAIAERRKVTVSWTEHLNQPAVAMDHSLTAHLQSAIIAAGLPSRSMPSGAGHDAMIMASRVPTAMLFLRSPAGVSHDPSESVLVEDVEAALQVGKEFLQSLAAKFS